MSTEVRERFRHLHDRGTFLMPNAHDLGAARLLESLGFQAIATTSSGFAATLGRPDQATSRQELVEHTAGLCAAVRIPVSVDAEHCFAARADGVGDTVRMLARAGAAGVSIEDFDPDTKSIYPLAQAVDRVAAAAVAARDTGVVLTARAENHLYGVGDLDDTIRRLVAFRDAGADVVFAPGVTARWELERLVAEVDAPLNALIQAPSPDVAEMTEIGVRRLSTGGALAFVAYGALMRAARELLGPGTHRYLTDTLSAADRAAFL